MRLLICTDRIGALASVDAGAALGRAFVAARPEAQVAVVPMAAAGADLQQALAELGDDAVVVSAPTDLAARTVTLTRMSETAARFRSAADRLYDIENTVNEQLKNNVTKINSLAKNIADVNEQIASATGNGQVPNDLLDKRDQLIRELNQYIQTTQIPADDGSVGLFIAGSQPLVLGNTATPMSVSEISETTAVPFSSSIALLPKVGSISGRAWGRMTWRIR